MSLEMSACQACPARHLDISRCLHIARVSINITKQVRDPPCVKIWLDEHNLVLGLVNTVHYNFLKTSLSELCIGVNLCLLRTAGPPVTDLEKIISNKKVRGINDTFFVPTSKTSKPQTHKTYVVQNL